MWQILTWVADKNLGMEENLGSQEAFVTHVYFKWLFGDVVDACGVSYTIVDQSYGKVRRENDITHSSGF